MGRTAQLVGSFLLLVGVFWSGRVSSHGVNAFSEHWWCPIPLALVAVGAAVWVVGRRSSTA